MSGEYSIGSRRYLAGKQLGDNSVEISMYEKESWKSVYSMRKVRPHITVYTNVGTVRLAALSTSKAIAWMTEKLSKILYEAPEWLS